MGRTIPSVSGRLEERMARWERFARHLRERERESFRRLAAAVKGYRGAIDAADEADLGIAILLAIAIHIESELHGRDGSEIGKGQERLAGP